MDTLGTPESKVVYDMGGYELLKKYKENKLEKEDPQTMVMPVTLEQLYTGIEMSPTWQRNKICPGCVARSKSPYCVKTCTATCAPTLEMKIFMQGNMRFQQQQQVPSKKKCRKETGAAGSRHGFPLNIERGMSDGETITFVAEGEQME